MASRAGRLSGGRPAAWLPAVCSYRVAHRSREGGRAAATRQVRLHVLADAMHCFRRNAGRATPVFYGRALVKGRSSRIFHR